jgi:hypothetical protein
MMNIEAATDAKPDVRKPDVKKTSNVNRKDMLASIVTLIAIAGFAAFVMLLSYLLSATAMNDLQWGRFTYLLTGVETITFTAIGWLFGKEIHRGETEQLEKQMKEVTERSKEQIADMKEDMGLSALQSKEQITEMKKEMAEVMKKANDERERADSGIRFALTEKERGFALYQAIQQLSKTQDSRRIAQEEFINRFSLILSNPAYQVPYEETREFAFEFGNILNRLTREDVDILCDIADQLYPELNSAVKG